MKLTLALSALACLTPLASHTAPGSGESDDPRDLVAATTISLEDAVTRALAAQAGSAVSAEVEREDGRIIVTIAVVAADGLHEVNIDAKSGALLENDLEGGRGVAAELRAYRTALRHAEHDLVTLVKKANGLVAGHAVAAELGFDEGQPICEVLLASGRYLVEVEVEARAGHVVDLEFIQDGDLDDEHGASGDDDDDDEHASGDDDEDEDGDGDDEEEDEDED